MKIMMECFELLGSKSPFPYKKVNAVVMADTHFPLAVYSLCYYQCELFQPPDYFQTLAQGLSNSAKVLRPQL